MPLPHDQDDTTRPAPGRVARSGKLGLLAAGLLVLGGATGAVVVAASRPSVSMAPVTPVAIRSLTSGIATIRGQVAEIYGNKFIVADRSGRALVDTGPEGDGRALVTPGEPVTVQGRFERGVIHAAFLVGPDNKVLALGPLAGPPHGPHGPHGRPGDDRGPDGPPPPPPPPGDRAADAPLPPSPPVAPAMAPASN